MQKDQGQIEQQPRDRIEGNKIILDGEGFFPKQVIILLPPDKMKRYEISKTRKGGYLLK
jgi:hypothetical protein